MERIDPKPGTAHKKTSLIKAIAAAVLAGVITFVLLFVVGQLQPGTAGALGAGVAIVVGGLVAAITLPTPRRER